VWCHSASIENNTATVVNVDRLLRRSSVQRSGGGEGQWSDGPLQCIGRDALLSRLSRLYGADAAVDVAPFPASSEESTNSVCFRYKAVMAGWYGLVSGAVSAIPIPNRNRKYRPDTNTEYWYRSKPSDQ